LLALQESAQVSLTHGPALQITWQMPPAQVWHGPHSPHEPPQPSSPQRLTPQSGWQSGSLSWSFFLRFLPFYLRFLASPSAALRSAARALPIPAPNMMRRLFPPQRRVAASKRSLSTEHSS
jgi:hypothetical protein